MSEGVRPLGARRTRATEAFFAQVASGRPGIPYCLNCQRSFFYPRARCPRCHGAEITLWEPAAPFRIRTHTWVVRPQSPEFFDAVPILMIAAELEGVNVIAEGLGWTQDHPPRAGERTRLIAVQRSNGSHVLVFVPADHEEEPGGV